MKPLVLGVVSSHGGSNLQAILDACRDGTLAARVGVVVSNNSASTALERARTDGVAWRHISRVTHPDDGDRDDAFVAAFAAHGVTLVALAGYNLLLGSRCLAAYRNRVLNIHPAPLPRFGGRGMFGVHTHEAVLAAGVARSGPTVHLCDERYDTGPVVAHQPVDVLPADTPQTLAARVLAAEHLLYVRTLQEVASGAIDLDRVAAG